MHLYDIINFQCPSPVSWTGVSRVVSPFSSVVAPGVVGGAGGGAGSDPLIPSCTCRRKC